MNNDLVIAGFGSSVIERRSERSVTAVALDAVMNALTDARVERDDVDGYIGAPFATNAGSPHAEGGDEVSAKTLAQVMGWRKLGYASDLFRRYPTDMVTSAAHALVAGDARFVVGLRAMYNIQGRDYASSDSEIAYGADQFVKPFGYNLAGARFALRAQQYMARHAADREALYDVVALSRRHANRNPLAIWKGREIERETYLNAQMISSPHCLYDCDMPVCGAAAFVMCRAADLPAGAAPAYVTGWAGFQTPEKVFTQSGRAVTDLACAQLYDGFSSMVWEWLEAFGVCPPGTAWRFVREGKAELDGLLPLNTFGGSLGEGRLHGMGHLREGYFQASGRAADRQSARTGPVLIQVGPFDDSAFVMLEPEPRRLLVGKS